MMHVASFQEEWPYAPESFDGLFCRGSLNYFGCSGVISPESVGHFLDTILATAKADAWIWIVPWIRPSASLSYEMTESILLTAAYILKKHGVKVFSYNEQDILRYEIGFDVPYPQLWTRNLSL